MASMNTRLPHMQRLYGCGRDLRKCDSHRGRCSICAARFPPRAVVCIKGHIREQVYRLPRAGNKLRVPVLALLCENNGRHCSLCHFDFGDPQPNGAPCPYCGCVIGKHYDLGQLIDLSR